jgi:hypothetical protein
MEGWLLSTAMTYTLQGKQYVVLAAGATANLERNRATMFSRLLCRNRSERND